VVAHSNFIRIHFSFSLYWVNFVLSTKMECILIAEKKTWQLRDDIIVRRDNSYHLNNKNRAFD